MTSFNTQTGNGIFRIQIETDDYESYLAIQEACRMEIDRAKAKMSICVEPAEFDTFAGAMTFLTQLKRTASKRTEFVTAAQYYILLGQKPVAMHHDYGWPVDDITSSRCVYHLENIGSESMLKKEYVVDLGKPIRID